MRAVDNRAAFEAWARTFGLNLERRGDSDVVALQGYINWLTQAHWVGWQAASARYEGVVEAARALLGYEQNGSPAFENWDWYYDRLRQALVALDGAK